jgi:hypothetical protein
VTRSTHGLAKSRCDMCSAYLEWRDVEVPVRGSDETMTKRMPFTPGSDDRHRCRAASPVKITRLSPAEMAELGWDKPTRKRSTESRRSIR